MSELKPCPFCGGEAKAYVKDYGYTHYWRVSCSSYRCGVNPVTNVYVTTEDAIAAWNTRATPGSGTCECVWNERDGTFHCSECDALLTREISIEWPSYKVTPITLPNYCPNCGARTVKR